MKTLKKLILIVSIILIPTLSGSASNPYTIQVAGYENLETARENVAYIASLVKLPVRLEKLEEKYVIRAGVTENRGDLVEVLETLKRSGYPYAFIRVAAYHRENALLEIEGNIDDKAKQKYLLELNQRKQSEAPPVVEAKPLPDEIEEKPVPKVVKKAPRRMPQKISQARRDLIMAWSFYRDGNYDKAMNLFDIALKSPETVQEARLGKAYTWLGSKNADKALPLFEMIVKDRYRTKETLPVLMSLLVERNEYSKAYSYIELLPKNDRAKWQQRIDDGRIRLSLKTAMDDKNPDRVVMFVDQNLARLKKCQMTDLFLNAAQALWNEDRRSEAINVYQSLVASCSEDRDLKLGILYKLQDMLSSDEMEKMVIRERALADSTAYGRKLDELRMDILKRRLNQADPDKRALAAREILSWKRADKAALSVIAWDYYNRNQNMEATKIFSNLNNWEPENKEYARGYILALLKDDRYEDAIRVARTAGLGTEEARLKQKLLLAQANEAYNAGNYAGAERACREILTIDPKNTDAPKLLAWSLYNQGKTAEALPLFVDEYKQRKDPAIAQGLLYGYDKEGERRKAVSFAREMATAADSGSRIRAGTYLFSQDMPITAAQCNPSDGTCYFHADEPWFGVGASYRHHNGDPGLSELSEMNLPIFFRYPFHWGNAINLNLITRYLNAGNPPANPRVGSYFLHLNGNAPVNDLTTSLWTTAPYVHYEKEGIPHFNMGIGTTPIGADIAPMPVFTAEWDLKPIKINLHQCSVTESLLSYVGMKDPYSDDSWGRVLRSGIDGEFTVNPYPYYWITVQAGYDYYWGKNVWDNHAVFGTASFGRSFDMNALDVSLGVFATAKHFERNTNFFTYGHGGYFSPQEFYMAGPSIRIASKPCQTYWFCLQGAAGYQYQYSRNAPYYPGDDRSYPALASAALAERMGQYEGVTDSGFGFNAQLKGIKLLIPYLAIEGYASVSNTTTHYTEWVVGINLNVYLDSRTKILPLQDPCGAEKCCK